MTLQGEKKQIKKIAVANQATKKTRVKATAKVESQVQYSTSKDVLKENKLQSLAMIHRAHGDRFKPQAKKSLVKWTRMSQVVESNWSLWHLTWSILWRIVLIVVVVRFFALLTVAYLGNVISTI